MAFIVPSTLDSLLDYGRKITDTPADKMPAYFQVHGIAFMRGFDTHYLVFPPTYPYADIASVFAFDFKPHPEKTTP